MEGEDAGLTLWDLRSDTDHDFLQSAEWECDDLDAGTAADQARPPAPMALMALMAGEGSHDGQISTATVKREHTHDSPHEHQSAWSKSVHKFKSYYESFDESQIDNDGWFVEEPGQDKYNEDYGKSRQAGPAFTSTTTARKRPFTDMNSEGIGKIINLANFRSKGSASDGQWLNYQINKKRKHEIVATTTSKEPSYRDSNMSNATSNPRFACKTKSIGQIGSMSLPACPQEAEREGSHCRNKNQNIQKSSGVHDQLPDVVPNQSQQKLKAILEQAVNMADKATLAQSGLSSAPSGYVLKSYMYSQAQKMVASQGRDGHGDKKKSTKLDGKQKPRPSERARILRRMQPKPTPPSDRTFLALIPVVPQPINPVTETLGSSVEEKGKTDEVKTDENRRVTRSQVKKLHAQPKPSQAELGEEIAQSKPVPNPLYSAGTLFRRIAPKPEGPIPSKPEGPIPSKPRGKIPSKPPDPTLPKSQVPAPMFVPIFELVHVPVKPTMSTIEKPAPSARKLPLLRSKTSSGRRKQDPLSVQTRGEKWRQEESEMLVEESREADEVNKDQSVVNLISDEEEEEVDEGEEWEVLEVEVKTEDEADHEDISW